MTEGRISYELIGRRPKRGYVREPRIILETDSPERIYVTDAQKRISQRREPYIVLRCSGNKKLILKGIRMKSFEEQIPNLDSIISAEIEITQREHASGRGRKYYTVEVNKL